ncbi:putative transcriptional regulator, DtxR family [Aeropyrum pernix K1]|uniref:Uncharacterized HTH-type transcriptional regulator APE_0142 n=1 Tax=Aeropyrum pernix (strain ATCC 700893 / DSM 11879 / JCM 9820 / NBRC 100138 / K1) TaxID=272557 RepID=Y142_AERPE|nr:metal-dependent transcriptional regulator [Aeropyrum pernix]Q9YFV8.1 RecName: Full=Uncharacterized HTH-type transcriptional regulator APE_0142 [Aeropyrum pernix K1]BAA79053.1 putative transcriptional regulator, DtxR family [Aeropyrum pernix K1]
MSRGRADTAGDCSKNGRRSRILHYLMAIYLLNGLPGGEYARFIKIARLLDVSPSTVSIMTRRLQMKGLVELIPNMGVRLTEQGLKILSNYLWKSAILEVLLARAGVDIDNCRGMGLRMAEGLSDEDAWILYKVLGEPKYCPHKKPIIPPDEINAENARQIALCCGISILQIPNNRLQPPS